MIKIIIIHNGLEVYREYLGSLLKDMRGNTRNGELGRVLYKAFTLINKGEYMLEFHYNSKDTTKASVALMVTITD